MNMNTMTNRPLFVLAVVFVILGTLFTVAPELLEHSPVGFEQRGVMHHAWHYSILIGGLALWFGLSLRDRVLEAVGLIGCLFPILLNLAAIVTAGVERLSGTLSPDVSGIDVALRLIVVGIIVVRLNEIFRGNNE